MNPTIELVEEIAAADLPLERKIIALVAVTALTPHRSPESELAHQKLHMLAGSRQTSAIFFLLNTWTQGGASPSKEYLATLVPGLIHSTSSGQASAAVLEPKPSPKE